MERTTEPTMEIVRVPAMKVFETRPNFHLIPLNVRFVINYILTFWRAKVEKGPGVHKNRIKLLSICIKISHEK